MIVRLARIFTAELLKLLRRRVAHVAAGLGLVVCGLTVLLSGVGRKVIELQGGEAVSSLNGFEIFASALQNGAIAGAIPLLVLAGLLVVEEYELGTAKIVFSKPVRRSEVVLAKGLLLILAAVVLVALVAVAAAGLVHVTNGFHEVSDPAFPSYVFHSQGATPGEHDQGIPYYLPKTVAVAIALTLPPLVAVLLIGLFLSTLSSQSGVAVGMCFGVTVLMFASGALVRELEPYLVSRWLLYPTDTLKDIATGISSWGFFHKKARPELILGLLVSLVTGGVAWGLAIGVTVRRQVLLLALAALPALALLLGPGGAVAYADQPRFRITQHRVAGQVWGMRIVDMDRDGLSDMVVLVTRGARGPEPRRFLAIFYQSKDRGFARTPDQVLEVPGDAVARILADLVPKSPGLEIGYVTPSSVFCLTAKDRVFGPARVELVRESSLFDVASGSQLPSWDDGAQDVDGDGLTDLLLLRKGDAVLYLQQPAGGYRKAATFPLEYKQRFGPRVESVLLRRFLSFSGELGRPVLVDIDGDGRLDLTTLDGKSLRVYLQRPGGRFAKDPDRSASLEPMLREGEEDGINRLNADLTDVDGDGRADLLLFRNLGRVGVFESLRTQVLLFRAKPSWDMRRPTQIINLGGISMSPKLIDIDGDGDRDLVVSSLRTDLISNVGTALFESVTVTYHIFLYHKDKGRFSTVADFSRDLDIDVERVEGGGTVPLAYFWGDYTGDGVRDMLTLDKQDLVSIYPGELGDDGDELDFSEDDRIELVLETSNSNKMQDINWDGRHDMVFWYWDDNWESVERGVISVVLSR